MEGEAGKEERGWSTDVCSQSSSGVGSEAQREMARVWEKGPAPLEKQLGGKSQDGSGQFLSSL